MDFATPGTSPVTGSVPNGLLNKRIWGSGLQFKYYDVSKDKMKGLHIVLTCELSSAPILVTVAHRFAAIRFQKADDFLGKALLFLWAK